MRNIWKFDKMKNSCWLSNMPLRMLYNIRSGIFRDFYSPYSYIHKQFCCCKNSNTASTTDHLEYYIVNEKIFFCLSVQCLSYLNAEYYNEWFISTIESHKIVLLLGKLLDSMKLILMSSKLPQDTLIHIPFVMFEDFTNVVFQVKF